VRRILNGENVPSKDVVAPDVNMDKKPDFSINREVDLFLWATAIVLIKAVLVVLHRRWFST